MDSQTKGTSSSEEDSTLRNQISADVAAEIQTKVICDSAAGTTNDASQIKAFLSCNSDLGPPLVQERDAASPFISGGSEIKSKSRTDSIGVSPKPA